MIDLESVKTAADLLAICQALTPLRKHASTNGGEWCGPCPWCGGDDRFYVQPYAKPYPRWACRQCTPAGDTVIGLIARRDGLDPKKDIAEICKRASNGHIPTTTERRPVQAPPPRPAYAPPAQDWQKQAAAVIESCQNRLWQPAGAKWLQYLRGRGLKDDTIRRFGLGYSDGATIDGMFAPVGVLIPCTVASEIWYLKIRQPPGFTPKYKLVAGSRPAAIYNADSLAGDIALVCEGEFDAMICWQEIRDVIPAATLGSASNTPDLASWGSYLLPLQVILAAYDTDNAGENGAARLHEIAGDRMKLAPVPTGKDINDYYLAGGDLWQWIKPHLALYDPASVND